MGMLTAIQDIPAGSHRVEVRGDRVVIRDLELFCGYDPDIDDAEGDEVMSGMTAQRISEIVDRTNSFIERGSTPKLVIRHKRDGEESPHEAVGNIENMRAEDRRGVPYILGDVEMSRMDFDAYIASNRYPRRSAEIWRSGHMSEVALLGRETPRRPLPDTKFERDGELLTFSRALPPLEFAHPGASNTYVPDLESEMDMKDIEARFSKLEKRLEEMMKTKNSAEEDAGDDEKEENARPSDAVDVEAVREQVAQTYQRQIDDLKSQIEAGRDARLRERAEREIKDMETEGFRFGDHRARMVDRLIASKDMDGELSMLRDLVSRDPIGHTVPALSAARTPSAPDDAALTAARERAKARCQREGKHTGDAYRTYLDEEMAQLKG